VAVITAQIESLAERLEEMKPLLGKHYDDLSLHKAHGFPLDPNFAEYLRRDAAGQVLLATVRMSGQMIGYFVGFVVPGLHYQTCLTLTMDIFFIDPAHRGGTGALRLFRCVEREARRRGVNIWFSGSKLHKDTGRMFVALGFEKVEAYYAKWLV
jgi:hypothetical protein